MKKDTILHAIATQLVRNWRTSVRSVAHSCAATGAMRKILLLMMMIVGVNMAWGQTTYAYYALHKDGKGYLKQCKGAVYNDGTFRYENAYDGNGSSIWVLSSDGYLQQEMYYLNVANGTTLYLSTTPVTQWDLVEEGTGDNARMRLQLHGTTKILGLNDNTPVIWEPGDLTGDKKYKYAACTLTVTENNSKWEGPKDVSWTVQSPQLVTYLRAYYLRNITVKIDKNDAGTENAQVANGDSRCHCSLTYISTSDTNKGEKWDINETTGIIYNKSADNKQQSVAASYTLTPLNPIVLADHPATTATVTIKVNAKALAPDDNKKYLLFSTRNENYRFPKATSSITEDALLPINGKKNDLTEAINEELSWIIECDAEGYFSFKNVASGRYIYYDAADYTVSDYGAVKIGATSLPSDDTRYKFRILNTGDKDEFKNCRYIIPYDKQFAVYKSDGTIEEIYFALYTNTSTSTKIASIYKGNNDAKWTIYTYEWEYRLWNDYSIVGDEDIYTAGDHTYTATTWFSRNIKGSPANTDYCTQPSSKTQEGITYTWEVSGLDASYITTSDVLASGTSTLTASITLPPGTRTGTLSVTAKISSPANKSNNKTIPLTLYNLNPTFVDIDELSDITDANGLYRLTEDNTYTSENKPGVTTFSGTLDGNGHTISGLTAPLFSTLDGATVRNLTLDNVNITTGTNVGAVCGEATGNTRIYNCGILATNSSSVGGSNYVGGIVGLLDGSARVINCYSYANITNGTVKAGIVGYNNYASKYNDLKTMVMNCMFYGNITTGGSVYPIYGGEEISNDYTANTGNRLNNYNYFLYESPFSKDNNITAYKCALPAEERFLVRFEFYRHLLNSTRELATWYATGSAANAFSTMAKWVLDKEIAPYPILKAYSTTNNPHGIYPSVVNYDPVYTFNAAGEKVTRATVTEPNKGGVVKTLGSSGSLTINIEAGSGAIFGPPSTTSITQNSISRPIIDKDFAQYNFNYGKVQLPYYNEVGTGNYTTASDGSSRVVTGWKIVSMTGGSGGGYSETNYDAPNYNYADRDHYGKDIYGTGGSGRIFAQGAYFNVPTGVTEITIQPYWAKCAYLSDANYDRYGYNTTDDLSQIGGGRYTNGSNYSINGVSQKVYTTFTNARNAMGSTYESGATVYDYAVVLVGNYHHHTSEDPTKSTELSNDGTRPLTVTSIDLNFDNEPDYCLIFRSGKTNTVCPIRYDFITLPGMAMAHKMATNNNLAIPGNCRTLGWFEITTTGLIKFGQFEHSYDGKTLSPLILMGGVIDQFVSNNSGNGINYTKKTKYLLFGDNVWFKLLSDGTHADKVSPTPHRPISITGGEYEALYLSGYFQPNADACTEGSGDSNAKCYIDGGKFGEVAGAGQEQISGNVTWFINHADIENFYGGGINDKNPITGNIVTTINNSHVGVFCGGPKFGDMATQGSMTITYGGSTTTFKKGKTITIDDNRIVTTTAKNCTFGTYFGAGFGGTSIFRHRIQNEYKSLNYSWNSDWVTNSYDKSGDESYRGNYINGRGVSVGYEYEFFGGSTGNVARMYTKYASFSLAKVNDVTSTLTGCKVLNNYYGGGSLGAVAGTVTSTLTDCTVNGNVFGAGYSVNMPTVDVFNTGGFITAPHYNETTALFENVELPGTVTYTWASGTVANNGAALVDVDNTHTIITNETTTGLGSVNGNVNLTITGTDGKGSVIGTVGNPDTGNVYGGGDQSSVTPSIVNNQPVANTGNTTVTLAGNTEVLGDVFGGGNNGEVNGSATVKILETLPSTSNTGN